MMTRSGFSFSTTRLQQLGDGERLDHSDRSSPEWRGRRPWRARCAACLAISPLPIETATTSVASPRSLMRTASSTAISSNGFIDILTLARSTPLPSDLTRTLTLKSTTRFTGTRIFMRLLFPARLMTGPLDPAHLATAKWPRPYCRPGCKSMVSRRFREGFRRRPWSCRTATTPRRRINRISTAPATSPPICAPPGDVLLALDQQG